MKLPKKMAALLLCAALMTGGSAAYAAELDTTTRAQQVVSELGVAQGMSLGDTVSRAQFAQLLFNLSSSSSGSQTVSYSMFNDVDSSTAYASSIYTAVQNEWMSGYLGGWFRPGQAVTLREAANGALALLGYTSADFSGNSYQGRQTAYYSAGLLENVSGSLDTALSSTDCIQLIYNLLKADTKQGAMFGASLGCTLDDDEEIDLSALQTTSSNSIRGPIEVEESLEDTVPFDLEKATVYLDGEYIDSADAASVDAGAAVYYSSRTRTVWVYEANVVTGEVTGVGYDLSGSLEPTALYVNGQEYQITDADLQEELSGGSAVRVGDEVTLLFDEGEDGSYTLRDVTVE